jgi:LDH2 family malate/lactate/ureidoglycolate dehydrogenase
VAGVLLSSEDLQRLCLDLLRALRTPQDLAQVVAGALHAANLAGHDSHGVIRMPDYAQRVREGKIDPEARAEVVRRRGAGACVSARRGWGQPGARLAAQTAAEIAGELGVGAVVLQESPHVGRLADYVELIAGSGRIGMAVTNAWVRVAPFGGRDRRLGTDRDRLRHSHGRRRAADRGGLRHLGGGRGQAEGRARLRRRGPPGAIIDPDGRPTDDPADFYAGGSLLPAQGHKGYGLAVAIEALGGALSGMGPAMIPDYRDGNGMFVLALEPEAFIGADRFLGQVEEMAQALRGAPAAPGARAVLLPGDPEARTAERRLRDGIPLAEKTWDELRRLASELGVAMPG